MLPRFQYVKAESIGDAVDLLDRHRDQGPILAGGTDLIIGIQDGALRPACLIDIKGIAELHGIARTDDGGLKIGACTRACELAVSDLLCDGALALREGAQELGTYQVRNRATVGGKICNASPACDLGPPLLVLGARLRLASKAGTREIAIEDFFTGVKTCCRDACELLTEVVIPRRARASAFLKRTRVRGHDLSTVNAAGAVSPEGKLRLALGAVAPTPVLVKGLDDVDPADEPAILDAVARSISPIDDVRGSRRYREHIALLLVRRLLRILAERR